MFEESAGVIPIHKASGEILLVHHVAGHWGFPKGHLEIGEGPQQAAVRELKEETGISEVTLRAEPIVQNYTFERGGVHVDKVVSYFVGTVASKEVTIQPEELQGFAWLTYEQALERLTFSKEILQTPEVVRFFSPNPS
jgi:8-oxo-dGTP pyrophosphatase MutT (NUDIX family)